MPHYVSLIRYTQQGIERIKESPARLDAAKKAAQAAGGKIHAWYLTLGQYDAVLISEFPDDETGAKFTLEVGLLGNVRTETLKAFTEAEYRKIIGSLR
ncbi:MAG: GYD domain-containing protein [Acidobacteriia bacterium]|nr:GYD domain-containing protein [Terriglobia bacterium]